MNKLDYKRRQLLQYGFMGLGAFIGNNLLPTPVIAKSLLPALQGELMPPDENGVRLPGGFSSRIIARSGQNIFGYHWHAAPDGGAVFATEDGGWVYVSNSEMVEKKGGAGALRFNRQGELVDAFSLLNRTSRNCAGGHTPWKTWLSCEEVDNGRVWECDPFGNKVPQVRNALGVFTHEAVAVDPENMQLYLTEDKPNGCLYRYTPHSLNSTGNPDLNNGVLEVAEFINGEIGALRWHTLPDPFATNIPTRKQILSSAQFNGGEGIWYYQSIIYFVTKGDNRVWTYDVQNNYLSILYNAAFYIKPVLTGVDNITTTSSGKLIVSEDGGDMQIVVVTKNMVYPLLQIVDHDESEVTGPAFSPDGTRLYFSSQRGKTGRSEDGVTFEVMGSF